MDALVQDFRYAIRTLRQSPGFTAVAVLTLALAIGANTTVFSLLNAIVLRTVAAQDPSGLAAISVTDARNHHPAYIYVDTCSSSSSKAFCLSPRDSRSRGRSRFGPRAR